MKFGPILGIAIALGLGACADVASSCRVDAADQQPCASGAIQYTSVAAQAEPARVIPIGLDTNFNVYERAKVLRAVNEWNVVLNGQVRLEILPTATDATRVIASGAPRGDGWVVAKIDSRSPLMGGSAMKRALAVTIGTRKAVIYVVADRLGSRDLGGIMMHEFGHAFGLGHDSNSQLMHPYYTGDKQRCIDKGTVLAVAAAQRLDPNQLNWCLGAGERPNVAAIVPKGGRAAWTAIRNR